MKDILEKIVKIYKKKGLLIPTKQNINLCCPTLRAMTGCFCVGCGHKNGMTQTDGATVIYLLIALGAKMRRTAKIRR